MVGIMDDDRVLGESLFFEFLKSQSDIRVHFFHLIMVVRVVLANVRNVGMVFRQPNIVGAVCRIVNISERLGLVGLGVVDHHEKRLLLGQVVPIDGDVDFHDFGSGKIVP